MPRPSEIDVDPAAIGEICGICVENLLGKGFTLEAAEVLAVIADDESGCVDEECPFGSNHVYRHADCFRTVPAIGVKP